jgi:hypothetical protein
MNLYQAGPEYPNGLTERIQKEMEHKFSAAARANHRASKSKAATLFR